MSALKKTLITLLVATVPMLVMAAQGAVNINTANKQELMDGLEGVTDKEAEAIIQHRKQRPFVNVHELGTLDGVSWHVLSINQGRITVGDTNWGDR